MPQKYFKHSGSLFSILFGVLAFVISVIIIYSCVIPKKGNIKLYLSDYTNYIEGINGDRDTLFIGAEGIFRTYLNALNSDTTIFQFDTLKHKINKEKYTYKKPELLFNRSYFSIDSARLYSVIDSLDNLYAKSFDYLSNEKKHFLNHNPKIVLWILLISMAIGFSFCLIPLLSFKIFQYNEGLKKYTLFWNAVAALLIIVFLFTPQLISGGIANSLYIIPIDIEPFFNFGITSDGLKYNSIMPFAGVIVWLVLIFTMNSKVLQLSDLSQEIESNEEVETNEEIQPNVFLSLKTFSLIRKDFDKLFILISVFLSFTILCNETLIASLNDLINPKSNFKLLPSEFSIVNGLMQTFFLIIIYFVINANFNAVKQNLIENKSQDVIGQHGLNEENKNNIYSYLKLIFTILAPLLGGSIEKIIELFFS